MNSTERAFSEKNATLIGKDARVIVAFSGGCDSLALSSLCAHTMPRECITVVYVDHKLRERDELDEEIRLNKANCEALGLELIVRELDDGAVGSLAMQRGGGIEEAARILRYRILEEERQRAGAMWILTAHHLQDQAETILMRIRSGSPSTTLSGIREKDDARHLVRPLLQFTREELESYNNGYNLRWSTDSTNADSGFSRNAVRNRIMPEIKAIWSGAEEALVKLAKEVQPYTAEQITLPCDLDVFKGKTAAQRMSVLFSLWDSVFTDRELSMTLISRVLEAIAEYVETGKDSTVGAGGGIFTLYHGKLYITDPESARQFMTFSLKIDPAQSQTTVLPGGLVFRTGEHAEEYAGTHEMDPGILLRMDSSLFNGKTSLRFAKEGDKVKLKGGWKTVGKLLQDMGIPAVMRGRIPVLEDGNGICAVFGACSGGRDRISVKFRSSLARNGFPLYIVSKG